MQIHGLNTLTLLDYPGHTGATIFLGACNFRCPFCQNAGLVLSPELEPVIPEDEVLNFLKKRQGILDGVCISGGEPTLHQDLPNLIEKIKNLGYLVKLDTNGTNPDLLSDLYADKLIDYAAMDIKSSRERYAAVSGIPSPDLNNIQKSIDFLMGSGISYEFRTTVVRELHTREDFKSIAHWLAGAKAYFLQSYKNSEHVICQGFHSCSKEELEACCHILKKKIPLAELRGID